MATKLDWESHAPITCRARRVTFGRTGPAEVALSCSRVLSPRLRLLLTIRSYVFGYLAANSVAFHSARRSGTGRCAPDSSSEIGRASCRERVEILVVGGRLIA